MDTNSYGQSKNIVLHQLPETPETLWLRLLGRGGTRTRAIDELEALSPSHPFKSASLKLLYNLSRNLQTLPKRTQEERKFIMRLAPLYEQDREAAIQKGEAIGLQKGRIEGIQQGEAIGLQKEASKLVLRQLKRRFGELPPHITETIQKLSVEKLEDLGEALLDFETQADLINWLTPTCLTQSIMVVRDTPVTLSMPRNPRPFTYIFRQIRLTSSL